jgi:hypothetical protein
LTKHSKEQKRFREKESSQKQGSRNKNSKKKPFGKEWECWGCGEKGYRLSDCRKTSKDDKERIFKEPSFSKKKLAILADPHCKGKDLALVNEKVWFPYILDSEAFTTVVPKSLLKKLKESGSGVVEATLEKDVDMKIAVKDVVTVAKSMIHITVQVTTRAGPVRIRSLRALVAQDEMEDMFIGEDLLKCLGIDPHEILAARLEEGTLEAEIDTTKMADKFAQRQKF